MEFIEENGIPTQYFPPNPCYAANSEKRYRFYNNVATDAPEFSVDDLLKDVYLFTVTASRYVSPVNEGISLYGFREQHLSQVLTNHTLRYLPSIFSSLKVVANQDTFWVRDIICGSLKSEVRKAFSLLLQTDKVDDITKRFFRSRSPKRAMSSKIVSLVADGITEELCYEEMSMVERYICLMLCTSKTQACTLPYFGRTKDEVRSDECLMRFARLCEKIIVQGVLDSKQRWKSEDVILCGANEKLISLFRSRIFSIVPEFHVDA